MKNSILFFLTLLSSFSALSQNKQALRDAPHSIPTISITPSMDIEKAIEISSFHVQSKIYGNLAQSLIDITFYNPNQRPLSADFIFPIPANSSLNGYALDVKGTMVEGVAVEKHKARKTFEKIVRQGIDPGLVEKIQGNVFKTRIFPLNARGHRSIQIKFITVLAQNKQSFTYQIPLIQGQEVKDFSLSLQAFNTKSAPIITSSQFSDADFSKWNKSYVLEVKKNLFTLEKPLNIQVPQLDNNLTLLGLNKENEVFFSLLDKQNKNFNSLENKKHKQAIKSIHLVWDASNSRYGLNHQLELDFLKHYFHQNQNMKVKLFLLRNTLSVAQNFNISKGNWQALKQRLAEINYDGATNISALNQLNDKNDKEDAILFFTDALHSFDVKQKIKLASPLYVISSSLSINQSYAQMLAEENNGQSLTLSDQSDLSAVVKKMSQPQLQLLTIQVVSGQVKNLPHLPRLVGQNSQIITGQLMSETAELQLNYGYKGKVTKTHTIQLQKKEALANPIPEFIWAQQQLNYLHKDSSANKRRLLELSQKYTMVSDYTSLIVLENLSQYIQHQIPPPVSLPKMRNDYFSQLKQNNKEKQNQQHSKISQVINMWETRKQWWKKEFPKYVAPKVNKRDQSQNFIDEEERVMTTGARMRAVSSPQADIAFAMVAEEQPDAPVAEMKKKSSLNSSNASIQISQWNPDTPYLKTLQSAQNKSHSYYQLKKDYSLSPAFYFDTASYFFKINDNDFALQVLSNIAELKIQDSRLLRTMAMALKQHSLYNLSIWAYQKVLDERREEPQSYRDLALALQLRITAGKASNPQQDEQQSLQLLYKVVTEKWDRFQGIEVTVLMEINQILAKTKAYSIDSSFIDKRLLQLLDVDLRITLAWDSDMTDIDLWVIEPSGEKVTYNKTLSTVGGMFHQDFTGGYGPEEYLLHKAPLGTYTIKVHFYGNGSPELTGGTTLYVDVFTNYGRKTQKLQTLSLRLEKAQDDFLVGTVVID